MKEAALGKLTLVFLLTVFGYTSFLGCENIKLNNQWRDVDPGIDGPGLIQILSDVKAQSQSGNGQVSEFHRMVEDLDSSVIIYFSKAPGTFGPVQSVMSLTDLSFMQEKGSVWGIEEVYVFFVDSIDAQGRWRHALLIDYKKSGNTNFTSKAFISDTEPVVENGEFITYLNDDSGQPVLALRSFDTVDGDLAEVIQLRVEAYNPETDQDEYIGKFSTLFGFGP